MQKSIIILITVLLFTEKIRAQEELSMALLHMEQQAFLCTDDTARNAYYLRKFNLYLQQDSLQEDMLNEARRVDYRLLKNTEDQSRFLWNASLAAQLSGKERLAAYYYSSYQKVNPDTGAEALLLGALVYASLDSAVARTFVNQLAAQDKSFDCLGCISKVAGYERKNKNIYLVSSALVPGLGSMLNGNVLKGGTSLLLNGGVAYCVYILVQHNLYLNAVLWGSALVMKFYVGNIKLTGNLFDQKEQRKKNMLANDCEHIVSGILKSHPVLFR